MGWRIIIITAVAAVLLSAVYLSVCVGRFGWMRKLSGGRKWLCCVLSLGLTAAVFALLAMIMSLINAVVVLLHAAILFLLSGIAVRIFGRLPERQTRIRRQGWIALGVTVIWLSAGYIQCHHVWQKDYHLQTDKEIESVKIALIADSHLGTTFDGEGFARHLCPIVEQQPDMLMIAGDFVDDSSTMADLLRACEALGETNFPYGVWYVYGNHDKGYFRGRDFTAAELEEALRQNGVHVLEDEYETAGDRLIVAGRRDASAGPRKDIDTLLYGADTGKYIIVLDHEPSDYEREATSPADLVLSGHTHGGQLIPINYVGLWFGMTDRIYGHENRQGTDFIVTSGISDWELLFKTGARSEYVIITITGQ